MDRATRSPPHFAVAFAMNVPRERGRHAARKRIFDHEIERFEIAQRITTDRSLGDVIASPTLTA